MLLKRSLLLICVLVGVVSLSACNQRSSTDDSSSVPAQSSVTSNSTDVSTATATDDSSDDSSDAGTDGSDSQQ